MGRIDNARNDIDSPAETGSDRDTGTHTGTEIGPGWEVTTSSEKEVSIGTNRVT